MRSSFSNESFAGQSAIVTGAGQGIGFEIAKELARCGAKVTLNDVDPARAKEAAKQISEYGTCIPMPGDAGDVDFIEKMVESTVLQFGKLDVVVANAGITLYGNFFDYLQSSFEQVMRVNLQGSFFLTQAAAKRMKVQADGGSIVLMSSVTAHQAHKDLAAYGMTKAGIEMLARTLVVELSPLNISINAVAPGATKTERTAEDRDYEMIWSRITPSGRPAHVGDIANAVLFLLSPSSRHITGQTLIVDGGWTSVSPPPTHS